ncbi:MAG TPA: hypothetical protein VMT94_07010 [Burkholderiales bacterium]|nr:hypothetical protein [Burkholderiales bacterium]
MPTNITVISTKDFIRANPRGSIDLAASRAILTKLISMINANGEDCVLVDTREAEVCLSIPDRYELGVSVATQPTIAFGKVALLVPSNEATEAEFFETVVRNRGASLMVFTDFETAIKWLIMKVQA